MLSGMGSLPKSETTQASLAELIDQTRRGPVLVRAEGGREAMLISVEEYEAKRQAAVERMFSVMDELGTVVRERAAREGLTPDDLMRMLDRKAKD